MQEALSARNDGIRIYGVGVTNFVDETMLSQIVFTPAQRNSNYWVYPSYNQILNQVDNIATSICSYSAILPGKLQKVYLVIYKINKNFTISKSNKTNVCDIKWKIYMM